MLHGRQMIPRSPSVSEAQCHNETALLLRNVFPKKECMNLLTTTAARMICLVDKSLVEHANQPENNG